MESVFEDSDKPASKVLSPSDSEESKSQSGKSDESDSESETPETSQITPENSQQQTQTSELILKGIKPHSATSVKDQQANKIKKPSSGIKSSKSQSKTQKGKGKKSKSKIGPNQEPDDIDYNSDAQSNFQAKPFDDDDGLMSDDFVETLEDQKEEERERAEIDRQNMLMSKKMNMMDKKDQDHVGNVEEESQSDSDEVNDNDSNADIVNIIIGNWNSQEDFSTSKLQTQTKLKGSTSAEGNKAKGKAFAKAGQKEDSVQEEAKASSSTIEIDNTIDNIVSYQDIQSNSEEKESNTVSSEEEVQDDINDYVNATISDLDNDNTTSKSDSNSNEYDSNYYWTTDIFWPCVILIVFISMMILNLIMKKSIDSYKLFESEKKKSVANPELIRLMVDSNNTRNINHGHNTNRFNDSKSDSSPYKEKTTNRINNGELDYFDEKDIIDVNG